MRCTAELRPASSNFACIVGLPYVSLRIVSPSALSFARRRLFSLPISAAFVASSALMDLSISAIALSNLPFARR